MWLNQPEKDLPKTTIPLLRAKPGGTIEANLTGRPVRLCVHFAMHRSWPCTAQSCTLCKRGISRRFYAYYPVTGKGGNVGIIELTALAESQLIKLMGPFGDDPRGCIKVYRPGGRRNMPCSISWNISETYKKSASRNGDEPKQTTSGTLSEKELQDALMRIWKLPLLNGQLTEKEYLAKLNMAIELQTKP